MYEVEDESDDDDDVVMGSSVSFTKYRNNKKTSVKSQARQPTIYRDPDARSYAVRDKYKQEEERRSQRSKGNYSSFLEEEEEEEEENNDDRMFRKNEGSKEYSEVRVALKCVNIVFYCEDFNSLP